MPYEVLGVDLESIEGREAFAEVYSAVCDVGGSESGTPDSDHFISFDENYEEWVKDRPDQAQEFLIWCADHESPYMRRLAGTVVVDWAIVQPDLATELVEKLMLDSDPRVRHSRGWVRDMLNGEYSDEFESLGIMRLARITKAYKDSVQMSQTEDN